jgi:hypothetical protein
MKFSKKDILLILFFLSIAIGLFLMLMKSNEAHMEQRKLRKPPPTNNPHNENENYFMNGEAESN